MAAVFYFVRLAFYFLMPVAGCVLVQTDGGTYGPWTAIGISIGLFVYGYLQWALVATERMSRGKSFSWIWILISVFAIGIVVRGNWKDWIIEQTFLEAVAFSSGLAVLAVYKAGKEQVAKQSPPWFLILLVFVMPVVLLIWKILPTWVARHPEGMSWEWAVFALAFLFSARAAFISMKPFAMGEDHLSEPLDRSWKIVIMVLWLIFLFAILISVSDK